MEEQLTAIDVIQHKVKLSSGLKWVVKANKERMSYILEEYIPFCHYVFHFISLNNRFLLKYFNSIVSASVDMAT